MAGYFDGEGCVSFPNARNIVVSIGSADRESLALFHEYFGGHFKYYGKNTKNSRRGIFKWAVSGTGAQKFLVEVLPWLRAKQDVALLGLKPRFGKPGEKVSAEEKQLRLAVQEGLKAINQRVTVG